MDSKINYWQIFDFKALKAEINFNVKLEEQFVKLA